MEEVKDPYHHKERFEKWSQNKEINASKTNSKLIVKFLDDFSIGLNISKTSKKGARSPVRLNTLRSRLCFLIRELEKRKVKDIRKVSDKQLHQLFDDMRSGVLKTRTGTPYKSTGDYVKVFKTFWHWYMKVSKERIDNVTEDLDTRGEKPKFVYLTEEDFNKILNKASADLKPILSLAFDSGMRVTEIVNIKVSDFSHDFKEVNIREETSKTFGRKIKLMMCYDQIKEYAKSLGLKSNDFLVQKNPPMINKELRKIGKEVLKPEQIQFKSLSLYDFRHSSACFWLPRYKSESAMKYRFGWMKSDMIHYYTEFLGMKDTITADDLYLDITKAELEKEIDKLKKEQKKNKERFSEEAIKKRVFEIMGEYLKEKDLLVKEPVIFGSTMKQKPDKKYIKI